jgi:hypothetical protein
MRRSGRGVAVLVLALAAPLLAAVVASSCTTFNGLTVPAGDASVETAAGEAAPDVPVVDAPPDAPAPQGYLPVAAAARLCSLVFQCPALAQSILASLAVPIDPVNYSLCMHWLAAPMPPDRVGFAVQAQAFACMAQGGTCAGAGSCLSLEDLAPRDPRCADAGADAAERCGDDGGTVYRCSTGYLLHCGAAYYGPGSSCRTGADGTHWCATGTNCAIAGSCIGTLLDYCGAGSNLTFGINCAYDGYTCDLASNDDSGLANCNTGTLYKPCNSAGTTCAGAVVEVCDGYDDSEFDCAALGETCVAKAGPAVCVGTGDACTPFDSTVDVCTGDTIALCIGGQKQSFDCTSLGLKCVPGAGAESAHCG